MTTSPYDEFEEEEEVVSIYEDDATSMQTGTVRHSIREESFTHNSDFR